jgi:hypothetical protein
MPAATHAAIRLRKAARDHCGSLIKSTYHRIDQRVVGSVNKESAEKDAQNVITNGICNNIRTNQPERRAIMGFVMAGAATILRPWHWL